MLKKPTVLRLIGAFIGFIVAVVLSLHIALSTQDHDIVPILWIGLMLWGIGPELGATLLSRTVSYAKIPLSALLSLISPFIFFIVVNSVGSSFDYNLYTVLHPNIAPFVFIVLGVMACLLGMAIVNRDFKLALGVIFAPLFIVWWMIGGSEEADSKKTAKAPQNASTPQDTYAPAARELSEWDKKSEVQKQYEREQAERSNRG